MERKSAERRRYRVPVQTRLDPESLVAAKACADAARVTVSTWARWVLEDAIKARAFTPGASTKPDTGVGGDVRESGA